MLDAQRRLADAGSGYYRSVVDFNRAMADVHYARGTLLDYNGVFLNEGPWPAKAYSDANRSRVACSRWLSTTASPNTHQPGLTPQLTLPPHSAAIGEQLPEVVPAPPSNPPRSVPMSEPVTPSPSEDSVTDRPTPGLIPAAPLGKMTILPLSALSTPPPSTP